MKRKSSNIKRPNSTSDILAFNQVLDKNNESQFKFIAELQKNLV